jgi:hypothetical protein
MPGFCFCFFFTFLPLPFLEVALAALPAASAFLGFLGGFLGGGFFDWELTFVFVFWEARSVCFAPPFEFFDSSLIFAHQIMFSSLLREAPTFFALVDIFLEITMSMSILSMECSLASPSAVSFVAAVLKKACWVA